jgi:hypothetical protein
MIKVGWMRSMIINGAPAGLVQTPSHWLLTP